MIELDKDLIRRCNNQSMYNSGDIIKEQAEDTYKDFSVLFQDKELNSSQLEILGKRKVQFKELITNLYNEYLNIAANFVPVNVAGPAKYPTNKMNKVMDRMDTKQQEIVEKVNKFLDNTNKMLKNAYTKDEIINKYRNGYNEPISTDDPLAKEKLEAKLAYLEEKHSSYKEYNKKARQNGKEQLAPYVLQNSNQNIKSVKDRLNTLERMNNLKTEDYKFEGGEVKFDKEDMRVKIFFDDKPNEDVRNELKSHAFKWSPRNMAWQRKLTPDAIYMTKRMFEKKESPEINLVEDHNLTM